MDGNTRTVQRHGTKIAKSHMMDWFIILFLIALVVVLNLIHPFHRFIGKEMINGLKYPLRSNTVPLWAIPIISVILPAAIIFAFYIHRKGAYELQDAVLGLLFSVLITGVITDVIKDSVGLPRPDFFWRCFPDGREVYDPVTGNVVCHGKPDVMKEGFKSFPSGHTSWCFSGLGFLSLYLSGKIKTFDKCGNAAKLCITLLPLLGATLVGISRIDDYWHNMHDVVAGALLGVVVALLCYMQVFPTHHHSNGSRTDGNSSVMESQLVAFANEPPNTNCQTEMNNSFGTSTTTKNGRPAQDDLECGRP